MQRPNGFTLIELLVVVAIIALLTSILAPALNLARHLAYETRCAHNLRQLNLGLQAYANQSDGRFPLEPTEHNPHPDLVALLVADSPGLLDVFYCPQASYMETFAQDTVNYPPKGVADSVIDTPQNRAAGNVSYVYWSFRANKGIDQTAGPWRNPDYFIPRQLTTTGIINLDPANQSPVAHHSEYWVLSDFFRRKAPFPHARRHARGLNVTMLDTHVELIMGKPRDSYR